MTQDPQEGGIAFIGAGTTGPPMVRLVFCPHGGSRKPGASTHHLPRLVEHAKHSQRVEAGVKVTKTGGSVGQGLGWAAWVGTDHPASVPGTNEGLSSLERQAGSTPGSMGHRVHGGEEPAHPRFTRRVYLPPQAWVLGAWGTRGTQKALTRELRLKG